jgi:hypothetical protein
MKNKTFVLGIGAQKAGTTWLYDYLYKHPNTNMGFAKEYHIFDALYLQDSDIQEYYLQQRINQVINTQLVPKPTAIALLKFLGNTAIYFNYFSSLVRSETAKFITGDMTPSYAGLNLEAFQKIKQGLSNEGFTIKLIFLMRDPVERCISAARMELKKMGASLDEETEINHLHLNYRTKPYQFRTRYDLTIQTIEQVFDKDEIHYAFYETLFTQQSIEEVCRFLDMPYLPPDFRRHINVSRTGNRIPQQLKVKISAFYSPVYSYLASRFGEKKMRDLWENYIFFNQN